MKDRIEQLERIIPKAKANKKILPKAIECMEWELRALKAEQQVKNCSIPLVIDSLPEYDVEEINEIVVQLKKGERSLFEAISDLWNKAYTIGARDEYKTSCR